MSAPTSVPVVVEFNISAWSLPCYILCLRPDETSIESLAKGRRSAFVPGRTLLGQILRSKKLLESLARRGLAAFLPASGLPRPTLVFSRSCLRPMRVVIRRGRILGQRPGVQTDGELDFWLF